MPSEEARIDADFYAMIHQRVVDLADLPEETPADRRRQRRQRFVGIQWLAPWDGGKFPDESAFLEVCCYDLTRSGFSFFAPQQPTFTQLVMGFGRKPDLIYVSAEPIRATPVLLFPSGRVRHVGKALGSISRCGRGGEIGKPMVLVGCRFLERLEKP